MWKIIHNFLKHVKIQTGGSFKKKELDNTSLNTYSPTSSKSAKPLCHTILFKQINSNYS